MFVNLLNKPRACTAMACACVRMCTSVCMCGCGCHSVCVCVCVRVRVPATRLAPLRVWGGPGGARCTGTPTHWWNRVPHCHTALAARCDGCQAVPVEVLSKRSLCVSKRPVPVRHRGDPGCQHCPARHALLSHCCGTTGMRMCPTWLHAAHAAPTATRHAPRVTAAHATRHCRTRHAPLPLSLGAHASQRRPQF